MKTISTCLLFLVVAFADCKLLKNGQKKDSTSLYQIANMPVRALNYKPQTQYIADYEVLKSYTVGDSDIIKLDKILSSDSLIMKVNHRSCEFLPSYALKWSSGKVMLISLSPCSKIRVIQKATDTAAVNDLKEHSDLEMWVLQTASK